MCRRYCPPYGAHERSTVRWIVRRIGCRGHSLTLCGRRRTHCRAALGARFALALIILALPVLTWRGGPSPRTAVVVMMMMPSQVGPYARDDDDDDEARSDRSVAVMARMSRGCKCQKPHRARVASARIIADRDYRWSSSSSLAVTAAAAAIIIVVTSRRRSRCLLPSAFSSTPLEIIGGIADSVRHDRSHHHDHPHLHDRRRHQ